MLESVLLKNIIRKCIERIQFHCQLVTIKLGFKHTDSNNVIRGLLYNLFYLNRICKLKNQSKLITLKVFKRLHRIREHLEHFSLEKNS